MAELLVLDVGHGNCALILDTGGVTAIDAGQGATLLEVLEALQITKVETLVLSHADADHIGGAIQLLSCREIFVGRVLVNSDPRDNQAWRQLRVCLKDARSRGTSCHGLTRDEGDRLPKGEFAMEILHPSSADGLGTPTGRDTQGRRLSPNSLSGVIRVCHQGRGVALFPGDLDQDGLCRMQEDQLDLQAELLVFPHHGGRPGRADPGPFTAELVSLVRPQRVLFSFDRNRHDNPRPEVIAAVRAARPDAHIACTQLSRRCASEPPRTRPSHLAGLPARGGGAAPNRESNCCCLGSLRISFSEGTSRHSPDLAAHAAFVRAEVASPLCRTSTPS